MSPDVVGHRPPVLIMLFSVKTECYRITLSDTFEQMIRRRLSPICH